MTRQDKRFLAWQKRQKSFVKRAPEGLVDVVAHKDVG